MNQHFDRLWTSACFSEAPQLVCNYERQEAEVRGYTVTTDPKKSAHVTIKARVHVKASDAYRVGGCRACSRLALVLMT